MSEFHNYQPLQGKGFKVQKRKYLPKSCIKAVSKDYPKGLVECVIAYLKSNVRYRTGKRAKAHFAIVTLIYNAAKLAIDRINKKLREQAV